MKSIIDVSSAIYGGHAGIKKNIRGFPIGGIRRLFGIINAGLNSSDFFLCLDGGEIVKKELYPIYKAGRIPDYSVIAQIDLAKELLMNCDIPFHFDKRYEADDFIFSICRELLLLGDPDKVLIYSDDRDLACCVTEQISIHHMTSNGIKINRANYSDRVVNGKVIPYNTILLWKVFHGDPSDNYKALQIPGLSFETFANLAVELIEPLISPDGFTPLAYAEYPVFEALVREVDSSISEESKKKLLEQGRIAYPYAIDVSDVDLQTMLTEVQEGNLYYAVERKHMKAFGGNNINRSKFNFYCSMLGLNQITPGRSVDRESKAAQEFYSLLDLKAKDLSSGAIAVEHYRTKKTVHPHGPSIENMDLPI